jgi:hypothetical protein
LERRRLKVVGMQITIHVPDDMLEAVRDRLPPPEMGVLEAVALDAILAYLQRLEVAPSN